VSLITTPEKPLSRTSKLLPKPNIKIGAEFLSAIPGSVGGALAMNAGAFGFEIWSLVESVTTINTLGEVFKRSVTEFDVAYRKVVPQHKGEYFIGANLKFPQTGKQQDIQDLLKKRRCSTV
jgi:UDP-N-acetylmuramate dehydrogenase